MGRLFPLGILILSTIGCISFFEPLPQPAPCPFVVDDGPGFVATLPCGVELMQSDPVGAGVAYFRGFRDDNANSYAFLVISTVSTSQSLSEIGLIRFKGTARSATGDFLVLADDDLGGGALIDVAAALLSDNTLLVSTVGRATLPPGAQLLVFNTIELLDTDGSALNDLARQDSPVLLAPVPDLVAMFDDDSVYRLTSESLRQVRKWQVGDSVLIHPSTSDVSEDSFLTRIDDWLSLPADFVGFAERLVLTTLSQSILSATQAKLSDGTTWEIASADEFKLIDWNDGDNMALVRDPQSGISNLTHTLINLANGDAVAVKFVK